MSQIHGLVDFRVEDIPSQEGKVVFITGGTAGLGQASVQVFAQRGAAHIYFSGRNRKAGDALIAEVQAQHPSVGMTFVEMDMMSLEAVKQAAAKFTHDRLDVLMCNAGIMDKPPAQSKDGFEIHFAVNYLAHAILIRELLPVMQRTAETPESDVRLVSLTSEGWAMHPKGGISFDTIRTSQDGFIEKNWRYGQSKFASIIQVAELARRHPTITSVVVHPGVVETELVTTLPPLRRKLVEISSRILIGRMMTPEQGRLSQLWAAAGASKNDLQNGAYYMPVGVLSNGKLDKPAKDEVLAKKLYEWTEEVLAKY